MGPIVSAIYEGLEESYHVDTDWPDVHDGQLTVTLKGIFAELARRSPHGTRFYARYTFVTRNVTTTVLQGSPKTTQTTTRLRNWFLKSRPVESIDGVEDVLEDAHNDIDRAIERIEEDAGESLAEDSDIRVYLRFVTARAYRVKS